MDHQNDIAALMVVLENNKLWNNEFYQICENHIAEADGEEEIILLFEGEPRPRIQGYLESVVDFYSECQFQENFRMSRLAFDHLQGLVKQSLSQRDVSWSQHSKRDLLAVIWLLATPDSYRSICERFDMASSVLFQAFVKIINALRSIAPQMIKWPEPQAMEEIENGFFRMSGIRKVIGAVDGSYVKIDAPKINAEAYINRKSYHSVTLQAICDCKMKFIDCFVGYPSSVHDCRIFRNSPIYRKIQENRTAFCPDGQFILGDKAYPSMTWCVVPFKRNRELTEQQTQFNTKHSSARTTVERSFALLFGRFRRLKHLQMRRQDLIPRTIMAACVLHNICLEFKDNIVYSSEESSFGDDNGDRAEAETNYEHENSSEALQMRQSICDTLFAL